MTHYELNHVALHVADVEKSCELYLNTLKLETKERPAFDFPGAWFRLGDLQELHLVCGLENAGNSQPRSNHLALRADNLDEWEEYFRSIEQEYVSRRIRPDGAFQIYVADPDGHHIELFTGP